MTTNPQPFLIDQKLFPITADMSPLSFTIKSSLRDYDVSIINNENIFESIFQHSHLGKKNVVIIDEKILEYYPHSVSDLRILIISATENFKSLEGVTQILNFFHHHTLSKSDSVLVVGGGTLQDTVGFACAIYKRGVPHIFFPTTLLSMADSCIGGKVGVNFQGNKNQLGLIAPPQKVIINTQFLSTLIHTDIQAGLGEILKSCIMGGHYFVELYQQHVSHGEVISPKHYPILIHAALHIKKIIVEADEFDNHYRKSLNYGHTFGHVIESLSHYQIPHGSAVVMGMMMANQLSYHLGFLEQEELAFLNELCFDLVNPEFMQYLPEMSIENFMAALIMDKKNSGNEIAFIVLESIGKIHIKKLAIDDGLNQLIQNTLNLVFSGCKIDEKIL